MNEAILAILFGIATVYGGAVDDGRFNGEPLFCDRGDGLYFAPETPPWVALDVLLYQGWAECGDEILLYVDGRGYRFKAFDAGPLHRYYVEEHKDLPILVDVPAPLSPFDGLSSPVTVINVSTLREILTEIAM